MKLNPLARIVSILSTSTAIAQIHPERGLFDDSTGLITCQIGNSHFRGSGVIARDPRLIYSCAHVLYDNGTWASSYRFHRAYHSSGAPYREDGAAPRGYRYFSSYSSNTQSYGTTHSRTYALDFVVYYGDSPFGDAVGYWLDGSSVMESTRWKRIIGYPSRIESTGSDGAYYQHSTDWFTNAGVVRYGPYLSFDGVSTGPGNSGGPVFVHDPDDGISYLAGILVSGTATTAGVRGLDGDSQRMASNALGLGSVTHTFANTTALRLPDASRRFKRRKVSVSGFSGNIESISCSGLIRSGRRGDLAIYLSSPEGKIRWLQKPSGNRKRHVRFTDLDLTETYDGDPANGNWTLHMKDRKKGKRSTFREFSLTITAESTL